jgi:hypothetical protein
MTLRPTAFVLYAVLCFASGCDDHRFSGPSLDLGEECLFTNECRQYDEPVGCIGSLASGSTCRAIVSGKLGEGPCLASLSPRQGLQFGSLADDAVPMMCLEGEGLGCDAATKTCVALAAVGASCAAVPCVPSAECVSAVCVALPKVGEPCSPTLTPACERGAYCGPDAVCSETVSRGARCDTGIECSSQVCIDGRCE